ASHDAPLRVDGFAAVELLDLLEGRDERDGRESSRAPGRVDATERVASDELALPEADAEAETGLVGILRRRDVAAPVAVALLHPQRVHRLVPGGPDVHTAARGQERLPHRD